MKKTILHEWLKKGHEKKNPKNKGVKIGCLVAAVDEKTNKINVGYSKCNKVDTFDDDVAFNTAFHRSKSKDLVCSNNIGKTYFTMFNIKSREYEVPHVVQKNLPMFLNRIKRYFKDKEIPLFEHYKVCNEYFTEKQDSW